MNRPNKKKRNEIYLKAMNRFADILGCGQDGFICNEITSVGKKVLEYCSGFSEMKDEYMTEKNFPELFLFKPLMVEPNDTWFKEGDYEKNTILRVQCLMLCIEMTK